MTGSLRPRDYALHMMLAAVIAALCKMVDTILEIGRSAGWWQ